MSSTAKQARHPETPSKAGSEKTYAFVYSPGPQWLAGRPRTEQNLGAHRAYAAELYALGRVLLAGAFLGGGGFAVVRAKDEDEAAALLAADPAITQGILTGVVHRWVAVFDEAEELRAAFSLARANKCAVEALFEAVECRDRDGVRAAYDEDITIHEAASLPYGGDYHGLEGALRHGQGFRAAWDRFQPHEARGLDPKVIAEGDRVVVLWRHRIENPETGDRLELPAVSVYHMENAKIINSRMLHFDTAALLQFLERNGALPASGLAEARAAQPGVRTAQP